MKNIAKIIFDDESELTVGKIQPLGDIDKDDVYSIYKLRRKYNSQFKEFHKNILEHIDSDLIEDYAEWNLNMVAEGDLEEKDIDDFSDVEILEEAKSRRLFGENTSIISERFFDRFGKIMIKENAIKLDSLLTELEKNLNIIP